MTPDPALADRALAVAERVRELADHARRGRPLDALDANTLDRAARLLTALVATHGATPARRDTPATRPTYGPFDERRGGAKP